MSALIERQKALLAQHPDEWVLLIGDQLFAHTPDKDAIWDHWDRAWDGWMEGAPEPMVVPPFPERGQKLPIGRVGRGHSFRPV